MSLACVRQKINEAALKSHRAPSSVALLAVSKTQSAQAIRDAFEAGQRSFGENYVQEALKKQLVLSDLPIEWHFVGNVQSNKIKAIASHFEWVHSVDCLRTAQKLNQYRAATTPLNVCIAIHCDPAKKSGVTPAHVIALAKNIASLAHLKLRGVMCMPEKNNSRAAFLIAHTLFNQLNAAGFHCDTLSMGMSGDFEEAIAMGSTLVRIGSAIFGERVTPTHKNP
jgi:pyridoxal phosphate enzyme (YggS family)